MVWILYLHFIHTLYIYKMYIVKYTVNYIFYRFSIHKYCIHIQKWICCVHKLIFLTYRQGRETELRNSWYRTCHYLIRLPGTTVRSNKFFGWGKQGSDCIIILRADNKRRHQRRHPLSPCVCVCVERGGGGNRLSLCCVAHVFLHRSHHIH